MEGFYEEVIGSRSFASVWYWIVFALVWTRTTHWTLGVPYEDARLGRKLGGQYQVDFETMIQINTKKTLDVFDSHNVFFTAIAAFLLATIFTLGFWFRIQFMQAGFLLLFPVSLVGLLSIRLAHILEANPLHGEDLYRAYVLHRRIKQLIGAIAIMFAAFWGVSQTLYTPYALSFG
ncbi:MAG: component of SufBCD complex [Rhodobacteraceae bacterium]|nr:component of SufBCD complex [Paracoccaceae bacterium]